MVVLVPSRTVSASHQRRMKRLCSLLIDDEPNARMRLRRLLKDEEHVEVIGEAKDGLEAVTEIERLKPDLVFLDVQMPGLDGFETLKALSPELPLPLIIFLTGSMNMLWPHSTPTPSLICLSQSSQSDCGRWSNVPGDCSICRRSCPSCQRSASIYG